MSMSWIENANWETTPARPAPEGQTSNLIDPPSLGYRVTASNSVCGVFVVLIVALRFYTRMHIVRGLGGDDCEVFLFPFVCAFFLWCALSSPLWKASFHLLFPCYFQLSTSELAVYPSSRAWILY